VGSPQWVERALRRLKLRDLAVLRSVAEAGSMSNAARNLSVSTPVVWKVISDLESTVGVRLFDRTTRGVTPTAFGSTLLDCGVTVFDEVRLGLYRIGHQHDASTGDLRISAPEIMMAGFLPQIVEQFMSQRPAVRLALMNVDTANYFQSLRERNAELLFGRLPLSINERDLQSERLFEESFVVYCAGSHPLVRRRKLALADLLGEHWVLPAYASPPGGLIARLFRTAGHEPPAVSIETFSALFSAATVGGSLRIGMLPVSVFRFYAERFALKILPVGLPDVRIAVEMVRVKNRSLSPLAEAFAGEARKAAIAIRAGA
jgi:DNA-binding transcriptional LysR family regulator